MLRPSEPFNTVAELLTATTTTVKGVEKKEYTSQGLINCSFKSYMGTDTVVDGVYSVIDTAHITTWYRPDITSSGRLVINGRTYEIVGEPENISMRNQFLKLKVKAVTGGV